MSQATFALRGRNPDVLTCIANLSNDEVFTPPEFANQMLDTLEIAWAEANNGASIWSDKTVKFLDPFTKSGVFLREIVARLTEGLAEEIPDLSRRVDHILTKQVYGIGITELTSLLARRSVYCSKYANGKHSVATSFETEQGNIWFERTEHTWTGGRQKKSIDPYTKKEYVVFLGRKCKFCGANEGGYARDKGLETHAYAFIHSEDIKSRIKEIFGEEMKFDVIIGNPPYQLSDGGNNASSSPIYQGFVEQAKRLDPRYLMMIIPSRWFAGGKGLDKFREEMLHDTRVRELHDFFDPSDVFPGVDISGGVCYFLWARDSRGDCKVVSYRGGKTSILERSLIHNSGSTFIRLNEAISILDKTQSSDFTSFSHNISSRKPFGIPTNAKVKEKADKNDIKIFAYPKNGFIEKTAILKNIHLVEKPKVLISYVYGERGNFPYLVIGKPFMSPVGTCCSETYLIAKICEDEDECQNVISYMQTKFFRFLVLLSKNTQHATSKVYSLVPDQDFTKSWDDQTLYSMYGLEESEISFIESMVRPMELTNE